MLMVEVGDMIRRILCTGSGDVSYWVSDWGIDDRPWLIFLPGLTADHTLFDPQIEYFDQPENSPANCFVWDAPAHGASRPYPLDFSLDDLATMLHDILEVESIERPVFVGQSLGGYITQCYMDLFPNTLRGFVSIDSAPLQRAYMKNWEIWCLKHTKLMYESFRWERLISQGVAGTAETDRGRLNMETMMRSYEQKEYCALATYGYHILAEAIEANRPYEITCPTILLCGEHDKAASTARYNTAWHEKTGLELFWVPDAGHNSNVDNPTFVNVQIEHFLAELPT